MKNKIVLALALTISATSLSGCAALGNEIKGIQGQDTGYSQVKPAVEEILPAGARVTTGTNKNGFSQDLRVMIEVTDPNVVTPELIEAIGDSICSTDYDFSYLKLMVINSTDETKVNITSIAQEQNPDTEVLGDPDYAYVRQEILCQ